MKIAVAFLFLLLAPVAKAREEPLSSSYEPHRVSFKDMFEPSPARNDDSDAFFLDALTSDGMLTVTDIPGYETLKRDAMLAFYECTKEADAKAHVVPFPDGTARTTIATHTTVDDGAVSLLDSATSDACKSFVSTSDQLRAVVAHVVDLFAARLSVLLDANVEHPIMASHDGIVVFDTLADAVREGEHLEHFHLYHKTANHTAVSDAKPTIELHTDQGMFIAFVPGQWVESNNGGGQERKLASSSSEGGHGSDVFSIQLPDGSIRPVHFDDGDLAFVLGDGIHQYINPKIKNGKKLRAVPHAMNMPTTSLEKDITRVWYGRMILAPDRAFNSMHGMESGAIRHALLADLQSVSGTADGPVAGATIGCSSRSQVARLVQQQPGWRERASAADCSADQFYCWYECVEVDSTEDGVTVQTCLDQGKTMKCMDPTTGALWNGVDRCPSCVPVCYARPRLPTKPSPVKPSRTIPIARPTNAKPPSRQAGAHKTDVFEAYSYVRGRPLRNHQFPEIATVEPDLIKMKNPGETVA